MPPPPKKPSSSTTTRQSLIGVNVRPATTTLLPASATSAASSSSAYAGQLDPALLALALASQDSSSLDAASGPENVALDPALFELENAVNEHRKTRLGAGHGGEEGPGRDGVEEVPHVATAPGQGQAQGQGGDDEVFDPTLREIVDSLANAQQSSSAQPPGATQTSAANTIGAHLTDPEERERFQQSLLDHLAQANFASLFPGNYPQSPPSSNFLLPETNGDAPPSATDPLPDDTSAQQLQPEGDHKPLSPSSHAVPSLDPSHSPSTDRPLDLAALQPSQKRGRGRPKGSKNKRKAEPVPRRKKTPPPKKPKGRPPKQRTAEEQAEYEQRKEEKRLGIKRQKGRPRKFPGYLVREMRLKKNRDEWIEVQRKFEEGQLGSGEDGDDEGYDPQLKADRERLGYGGEEGGERGVYANGDGQHYGDASNGDMRMETEADAKSEAHQVGGEEGPPSSRVVVEEENFEEWELPGVHDGQSLLDAVGAAHRQHEEEARLRAEAEADSQGMDVDVNAEDARHRGDAGMREVFGLEA